MCQVDKKESQIGQTDKKHNFYQTDSTKAIKPLEKPIVGFSHENKNWSVFYWDLDTCWDK